MALKRDKYDDITSRLVRARDNYTCTRCGRYYPEGERRGLDASHFFGRANKAVRYDLENIDSHCRGCHQYLGSHPYLFTEWKLKRMGMKEYNALVRRANSIKKWTKEEKEEMYQQYKKMVAEYETK